MRQHIAGINSSFDFIMQHLLPSQLQCVLSLSTFWTGFTANKTLQNTVAIKVTKRIYQIQLQKGREPLQMAEKSQQ